MRHTRSRLLYEGRGIFIQPEIVKYVGSRSAAQFLQQIHYFITSPSKCGVTYEGKRWIYNTIEEWANILGYSQSTIKNCVRILQKLNIIQIKKLSRIKSDRTNFYTINYETLEKTLFNKVNKQDIPTVDREEISLEDTKNSKVKIDSPVGKNCPMVIQESTDKEETINKSYKSENSNENKSRNFLSHLMIKAWNDIIKPNGIVEITKKRCQYLISVMKNIFNWDLKKWQQYCHLITTSDFLMGKQKTGFKATIDWALKFETIQRILEGQYGIDKNKVNKETDGSINMFINQIDKSNDSSVIKEVKKSFLKFYGLKSYKSWLLSPGLILEYNKNSLLIKCPDNLFVRDNVFNLLEKLLNMLSIKGINRVYAI